MARHPSSEVLRQGTQLDTRVRVQLLTGDVLGQDRDVMRRGLSFTIALAPAVARRPIGPAVVLTRTARATVAVTERLAPASGTATRPVTVAERFARTRATPVVPIAIRTRAATTGLVAVTVRLRSAPVVTVTVGPARPCATPVVAIAVRAGATRLTPVLERTATPLVSITERLTLPGATAIVISPTTTLIVAFPIGLGAALIVTVAVRPGTTLIIAIAGAPRTTPVAITIGTRTTLVIAVAVRPGTALVVTVAIRLGTALIVTVAVRPGTALVVTVAIRPGTALIIAVAIRPGTALIIAIAGAPRATPVAITVGPRTTLIVAIYIGPGATLVVTVAVWAGAGTTRPVAIAEGLAAVARTPVVETTLAPALTGVTILPEPAGPLLSFAAAPRSTEIPILRTSLEATLASRTSRSLTPAFLTARATVIRTLERTPRPLTSVITLTARLAGTSLPAATGGRTVPGTAGAAVPLARRPIATGATRALSTTPRHAAAWPTALAGTLSAGCAAGFAPSMGRLATTPVVAPPVVLAAVLFRAHHVRHCSRLLHGPESHFARSKTCVEGRPG
uniref:hypothetical protein n=1 Tax=Actinomadura rudentiformis TaxID=359158 RepID=UPI00178C3AE8|nr:hypothetical protein [Actinomadura rudentiformis]